MTGDAVFFYNALHDFYGIPSYSLITKLITNITALSPSIVIGENLFPLLDVAAISRDAIVERPSNTSIYGL